MDNCTDEVDDIVRAIKDSPSASIAFLGILLLLGDTLRSRVRIIEALHLPASLLGGIIGWGMLELLRFFDRNTDIVEMPLADFMQRNFMAGWDALPGIMTVVIFAGLVLGQPLVSPKTVWFQAGDHLLYGIGVVFGQYLFCSLVTAFVLMPRGTSRFFAPVIPYGFQGGHGVVAGMRGAFDNYGFEEGFDVGLAAASLGLVIGVCFGSLFVNIGDRQEALTGLLLLKIKAQGGGLLEPLAGRNAALRAETSGVPGGVVNLGAPDAAAVTTANTKSTIDTKEGGVVTEPSTGSFGPSSPSSVVRPAPLQAVGRFQVTPVSVPRGGVNRGQPEGGVAGMNVDHAPPSERRPSTLSLVSTRARSLLSSAVDYQASSARKTHFALEERPTAGKQVVGVESLDNLAYHCCLLGVSIFGGLCIRWGITGILTLIAGESGASAIANFPLFPFALVSSVCQQFCITKFDIPVDRQTIERIINTAQDAMILAGMALLNTDAIMDQGFAFIMCALAAFLWGAFAIGVLARLVLPDYWLERGLIEFGLSMGSTATGLMLLRMADPENMTPVLRQFGFKQIIHVMVVGGGAFDAMAMTIVSPGIGWLITASGIGLCVCVGGILVNGALKRDR